MAINFNNVKLLSISQEPIKLDTEFKFGLQKTIGITGNLLDLSNDSGVENIFQETNGLIEVNTNNLGSINTPLDDITINGVSYGEGYVNDFNVYGEQIQIAEYTASIVVTQHGNLSEIILSQNVSTPTHTSTSAQLHLSDSELEDEDLKYLSSFDESFVFNVSQNDSIEITHNVSSSFEYRKSLISSEKDIWTGSTIQQSKLVNLKNKGKKSIKVSAGTSATYSLTLTEKSNGNPQEYTLIFDYLGQDATNWGSATVNFSGQSISLGSVAGRKKIKLSVSSPLFATITLTANSAQDTFFDNFKLYKTDELPIEKSKTLANFLFNNSPNYSIIQSEYEGKFKNLNLSQNFTKSESFDEINLNHSSTKKISHGILQGSDDYSLIQNSSLVLDSEGFIEITETSEVKALKDKSESNLRSILSSLETGGYQRSLNYITEYNDYFDSGCSTPTQTSTPNLYLEAISDSKNFDFFSGTATLSLLFTNDPSYVKDSSNNVYRHQRNESIEYLDGYFDLNLNGEIQGDGDTTTEKNNNSKNGLSEILNNVNDTINDIKTRYSLTENFNIVEKSINSNTSDGSISYNLKYSNKKSYEVYPLTGTPIIKKYEIEVSTDEAIRIFNEFNINCKVTPQFLKNLITGKGLRVQIEVSGYEGVSITDLLRSSKQILIDKSLMYGIGSDDPIPPTGLEQFVLEENFQHSNSENSLSYVRSAIDLSLCPGETPTETAGFLWGDWEATPTFETVTPVVNYLPTVSVTEVYGNITPTPYYTPYIPVTETETPSIQETQTETNTVSTTPETQTETITETVDNTYLQEVFIPKNYSGTIADLMPNGQIVSGRTCFNQPDLNPVYPNFSYVPSSINNFVEVPLSVSYAASVNPKDCEYLSSSFPGDVRFYSFIFRVPSTVPTPSDAREKPYPYYNVDIPEFWDGSFEDLAETSSGLQFLIGGYRQEGNFQYGNTDSDAPINTSDNLIRADENNLAHPNSNNGEVFSGPLIFKRITSTPNVTDNYDINQVEIPLGSNSTIGDLYTPTLTSSFSLIGYRECGNQPKRFNETVATGTTTALNYNYSEVVDNCNEITSNRKLDSFYIKITK